MITIHCSEGLGNRVAAMANGLSRAARIEFVWLANEHCPARWQDVFPAGIEGVTFSAGAVPWPATEWNGLSCERWAAAGDRGQADAAYGQIMAAMSGEAQPGCPVAICGRFHRNPQASPEALADVAAGSQPGMVFVLADLHRSRITDRLATHGINSAGATTRELGTDLDRSRDGILAYVTDWKRLLAAKLIIAADGPASALHPARAAGTRIIYV